MSEIKDTSTDEEGKFCLRCFIGGMIVLSFCVVLVLIVIQWLLSQ